MIYYSSLSQFINQNSRIKAGARWQSVDDVGSFAWCCRAGRGSSAEVSIDGFTSVVSELPHYIIVIRGVQGPNGKSQSPAAWRFPISSGCIDAF